MKKLRKLATVLTSLGPLVVVFALASAGLAQADTTQVSFPNENITVSVSFPDINYGGSANCVDLTASVTATMGASFSYNGSTVSSQSLILEGATPDVGVWSENAAESSANSIITLSAGQSVTQQVPFGLIACPTQVPPGKYSLQWKALTAVPGQAMNGFEGPFYETSAWASGGFAISNNTNPNGTTPVTVTPTTTAPSYPALANSFVVSWGKAQSKLKVGKTVKITGLKFSGNGAQVSYQWYVKGRAVKKATKSSFKITKVDGGKNLTVKLKVTRGGYSGSLSTIEDLGRPRK